MSGDKTKSLFNINTVICYVTFIPLVFGLLIQYDALSIIIEQGNYQAGILRGDSIEMTPTNKGNQSAVYFIGRAGSVNTSILVGNTKTFYADSLLRVYARTNSVSLPVWYKPDGNQTLRRNNSETEFPIWQVSKKTLLYLLGFCGPFILAIIWRIRLKRKLNESKANAN